jgi:hypothetical protein
MKGSAYPRTGRGCLRQRLSPKSSKFQTRGQRHLPIQSPTASTPHVAKPYGENHNKFDENHNMRETTQILMIRVKCRAMRAKLFSLRARLKYKKARDTKGEKSNIPWLALLLPRTDLCKQGFVGVGSIQSSWG